MRTFRITVNGKAYDVQVEELGASAPAAAPAPVVAAPAPVAAAPAVAPVSAPAPAAAPAPTPAPQVAAGAVKIESPMPGTILDIKVQSGQSVKTGDVLFILEAMKMENEIMAAQDGVITVHTSKGASVNAGDLLGTMS